MHGQVSLSRLCVRAQHDAPGFVPGIALPRGGGILRLRFHLREAMTVRGQGGGDSLSPSVRTEAAPSGREPTGDGAERLGDRSLRERSRPGIERAEITAREKTPCRSRELFANVNRISWPSRRCR